MFNRSEDKTPLLQDDSLLQQEQYAQRQLIDNDNTTLFNDIPLEVLVIIASHLKHNWRDMITFFLINKKTYRLASDDNRLVMPAMDGVSQPLSLVISKFNQSDLLVPFNQINHVLLAAYFSEDTQSLRNEYDLLNSKIDNRDNMFKYGYRALCCVGTTIATASIGTSIGAISHIYLQSQFSCAANYPTAICLGNTVSAVITPTISTASCNALSKRNMFSKTPHCMMKDTIERHEELNKKISQANDLAFTFSTILNTNSHGILFKKNAAFKKLKLNNRNQVKPPSNVMRD